MKTWPPMVLVFCRTIQVPRDLCSVQNMVSGLQNPVCPFKTLQYSDRPMHRLPRNLKK